MTSSVHSMTTVQQRASAWKQNQAVANQFERVCEVRRPGRWRVLDRGGVLCAEEAATRTCGSSWVADAHVVEVARWPSRSAVSDQFHDTPHDHLHAVAVSPKH